MARNPHWTRDELMLALDLYFSLESGEMHARHPKVLALSKLLNRLPIHSVRPDALKFRNPNGVGLKLNNFKSIDPTYLGEGMSRIGKLDKVVFDEFNEDRERLSSITTHIREVVLDDQLNESLFSTGIDLQEEEGVSEGRVLQRLHRYRERKSTLADKKKRQVLDRVGYLACEVCNFDFSKKYGDLGKGYIECHHTTPLAELTKETKSTLQDLALVCANCHRMLHRRTNLTLNQLRKVIGA